MRRGITSVQGRDVVITGAASGIGRACAQRCVREGARVHLMDIQGDALESLAAELESQRAGSTGVVRALDITDADAVASFADELHAAHGPAHVLLNVAGIATWGTVAAMEVSDWRRVIDVNLMGVVHAIAALVPEMARAGRGHVVNVSSAAGIIGMPWHAAYSASKFGVRGLSEVLRFDLPKHGVRVSLCCPGAVATPLTETVNIVGVDTTTPRFARLQKHFRSGAVTPEQAADSIIDGMLAGKYWIYTSGDIRAAHLAQRYVPPAYDAAMRLMGWAANKALPDVERATRAGAPTQPTSPVTKGTAR